MNVIDSFVEQATGHPERVAVRGNKRLMTYGELLGRSAALAAAFVSAGLLPGDLVAIDATGIEHICLTFAVAWAGGVSVAMASGYERWIDRIGVPAFLVQAASGQIDAALPIARKRLTTASLLERRAPAVPVCATAASTPWRLGISSGTTGKPKVVEFSHGSAIARSQLLREVPGLQSEHTVILAGPFLTFSMSFWMRELAHGGCVTMGVSPGLDLLRALDDWGCDLLVASPGNALALAQLLQASPTKKPRSLQRVVLGGAAITGSQRDLLRMHVCERVYGIYGATEVGVVAVLDPELADAEPDCTGRLAPWVEARLVAERGRLTVEGECGTLHLRSPMMGTRYLAPPQEFEADTEGFADGWFRSSDRGSIDSDNLVFLAGRRDDVINIGGNKIDPALVEPVVARAPGVSECVVVAARGLHGQQVLVAVVVVEGPFDPTGLRRHCEAQLAKQPWLVPGAFVRARSLPRNDAGKLMRAEIAARVQPRNDSIAK